MALLYRDEKNFPVISGTDVLRDPNVVCESLKCKAAAVCTFLTLETYTRFLCTMSI